MPCQKTLAMLMAVFGGGQAVTVDGRVFFKFFEIFFRVFFELFQAILRTEIIGGSLICIGYFRPGVYPVPADRADFVANRYRLMI